MMRSPTVEKDKTGIWRQVLPTGEHLQSPLIYCMHTVHTPHSLILTLRGTKDQTACLPFMSWTNVLG